MLFAIWPQDLLAHQDAQAPAMAAPPPPPHAPQTPEQLQQLVAPIALYPDSLVAQILAASTFPEQVVEAERWVQAHPDLQGTALGQAVDQQPWDPSVKAITAFPSVLGNMDKNLSWTSSLGDAYYNQQQDVMNAIQVMRQRAQAAGNLQTTPQQTVETQGSTIVIQPASPDVVYVPAYDPWLIYGFPIVAWPGWYPYPGIWFGGPYLSFGVGFGIGFFGGFGWGWGHWGFDWYHRYPIYNNGRYYSHSNTFYNRNSYYRGGGARGVATNVERGVNVERGAGAPARPLETPNAPPAFTITLAQRRTLSAEALRLLEDMPNPMARAASTRALSATTIMAVRPEAFRHAEAPVSAAATAAAGLPAVAARRQTAVSEVS